MVWSARRSRAPRAGVALASALLSLFTLTTAVSAAPEGGVVLDASATVVVREPSPGGSVPGAAVGGAAVTLVAYVTDFPEDPPIASLHGTTNPFGQVTFTGVPRAAAGAPTVHLAVDALREDAGNDANGCPTTKTWVGTAGDVASADGVTIDVETQVLSSVACPVLAGRIVDAADRPLESGGARASVILPSTGGAQAFPVEIREDGTFSQLLPAWGTAAEPASVDLEFVSAPTRSEPAGACVRRFAERAAWSGELALADGEEPPVLELVTEEFVAGEQCGAVDEGGVAGTEAFIATAPIGDTATATLPPSDTEPMVLARPAQDARGGALGAFLVIATALLGGLVVTARRRA